MLPYKMTEYMEIGGPTNYRDTIFDFLTYSTNGLLIRDSLLSFSNYGQGYEMSKTISTYTYTGNKIYGYSVFNLLVTFPGNSLYSSTKKDTLTLDANANVIARNNYNDHGGVIPDSESNIGTYTYDNNPSPMLNLNINKVLVGVGDIFVPDGSKNNITSLNEKNYYNGVLLGSTSENYLNAYTFKVNGYPSTVFMPYLPGTDYSKIVYLYKTL